jgi:hypothetical protein
VASELRYHQRFYPEVVGMPDNLYLFMCSLVAVRASDYTVRLYRNDYQLMCYFGYACIDEICDHPDPCGGCERCSRIYNPELTRLLYLCLCTSHHRWIEYEANQRNAHWGDKVYYPDDNLYSYMTNLQDDTSLMDKAFGTVVLADQHNRYTRWLPDPERFVVIATRFIFYANCLNEKHTRDDGYECDACNKAKAARGK